MSRNKTEPGLSGAIKANTALELIGSNKDGILQADLRRQLEVDSSRCSRIVKRLEKLGLIRRVQVSVRGRRTFRIWRVEPRGRGFSRAFVQKYIDTYLTEIYLLYLVKSTS